MSETEQSSTQATPPSTFGMLEKPAATPAIESAQTLAPVGQETKIATEANSPAPSAGASEQPKSTPAGGITQNADATQKTNGAANTTEQKPKEGETTDPQKSGKTEEKVVPEKYDLKLAEKSLLDKGIVERIAAEAKAQGLSQEEAQSLVTNRENDVAAFVETRKQTWLQETLSDKEIGGDGLKENVALANRMLDRFASPALKNELTKTGYGNHPEMVRMLVRIGKASANDKAIIPRAHQTESQSLASKMYDKTPNS